MFFLPAALALMSQSTDWNLAGSAAWRNAATHTAADAKVVQALARHGDVQAMRDYGLMLWQGQNVRPDHEAALGWFYEAAIRNDAASMYMLGVAFERGDGVGRDPKLAEYWINRAIENGYKPDSQR